MKLSIILPTLNEEKALPETLRNVKASAPEAELIFVDGGSGDRTREIAQEFANSADGMPLILIESPRGRGNQMNAGAVHATGDVLLFLHADTHLPPQTPALIEAALSDARVLGGNFRIEFVPHARLANLYTLCYNARSRFRIFYGDSCLFVRREVFERMGGYQAEIIMEDWEYILRLRKSGRLAFLSHATVRTSTRRFHNTWVGIRMLGIWTLLHVLHLCGVPQKTLERLYPEVR